MRVVIDDWSIAFGKDISAIRVAVLPPGELQSKSEDDVCRGGGVDAEYG